MTLINQEKVIRLETGWKEEARESHGPEVNEGHEHIDIRSSSAQLRQT